MNTFATEIFTIINSLAGHLFEGGVFAHNVDDNFDMSKPILVLQYRDNGNVKTLDHVRDQTEYDLNLLIVSQSTEINDTLADELIDALDMVDASGGSIADLSYVDDLNSVDLEAGLYIKTLNFSVIYNH
jgi:hypothetical protein